MHLNAFLHSKKDTKILFSNSYGQRKRQLGPQLFFLDFNWNLEMLLPLFKKINHTAIKISFDVKEEIEISFAFLDYVISSLLIFLMRMWIFFVASIILRCTNPLSNSLFYTFTTSKRLFESQKLLYIFKPLLYHFTTRLPLRSLLNFLLRTVSVLLYT